MPPPASNVSGYSPTSFPALWGFGGAGDEKALVQAGHVTRNMPNIWEYFVTWFYLNYASRKIIRIKILGVEAVNGKHGDK